MCGRFALYSDPLTLARRFGTGTPADLHPRYNVAPTQSIPIVRLEEGQRRFALARWGLIPHWAKAMDTGYRMINARAETVASKPAFRSAFRHRRCLIPADGFYEWQAEPDSKVKQPWFIALRDREPMAFAGLWESWHNPQGDELESCSIIVTDANKLMQPIHDRMPVILGPTDYEVWLDTENRDTEVLAGLLKPYPADEMEAAPVSRRVNSPLVDEASLLDPMETT